jgi:hypothetical protein
MNDRRKTGQEIRKEERLRAALRENLKRRKTQAKERAGRESAAPLPHDSAGIPEDKPDSEPG